MRQPGPYKSPDELGITPEEHAGLIAVMEYLRGTQVVHAATGDEFGRVSFSIDMSARVGFNMSVTAGSAAKFLEYDCGCAACIGGYLSLHMQGVPVLTAPQSYISSEQASVADIYTDGGHSDALKDLFFPHEIFGPWGEIKPQTAAAAIGNFLIEGMSDWRGAAERNGQAHLIGGA